MIRNSSFQRTVVYTSPLLNYPYLTERNINSVRFLSEALGFDFCGGVRSVVDIPADAIVFIDWECSNTEYQGIALKTNKIYGSVNPFGFPLKCIFHPLVESASVIPSDWPTELVSKITELDLSVPGYSVFSVEDGLKAYDALIKRGITELRIKSGLGFGTEGQFTVSSKKEVRDIIQKMETGQLLTGGLLIEANITINSTATPISCSWGYVDLLDGYRYRGVQKIGELGRHGYLGTDIQMVREKDTIPYDDIFTKETVGNLWKLKDLIENDKHLLQKSIRFNADIIFGSYKEKGLLRSYVTEFSQNLGGASSAEFMSIAELYKNNDVLMAVSASSIKYSLEEIDTSEGLQLCSMNDPLYGPVTTSVRLVKTEKY